MLKFNVNIFFIYKNISLKVQNKSILTIKITYHIAMSRLGEEIGSLTHIQWSMIK